jgi:hypothetical protein
LINQKFIFPGKYKIIVHNLSTICGIIIFESMSDTKGHSDKIDEIRIRNVSRETHTDLQNIADNYGISLSALLKPKLKDIANSYPAHDKLPKKEKD